MSKLNIYEFISRRLHVAVLNPALGMQVDVLSAVPEAVYYTNR